MHAYVHQKTQTLNAQSSTICSSPRAATIQMFINNKIISYNKISHKTRTNSQQLPASTRTISQAMPREKLRHKNIP